MTDQGTGWTDGPGRRYDRPEMDGPLWGDGPGWMRESGREGFVGKLISNVPAPLDPCTC